MKVPLVDLRAQYLELKDELDTAVLEVLASGLYTPGKNVSLLEQEIAASCSCKHGVAMNSGTDAIKIGLQAMGIKAGDEVITTPFTFVATIEAIIQNNAKPVFVDIEPRTFNLDPEKLEAAITPRTRAIIPIHLFGQIAEMEAIASIADGRGIRILEDAAQAIGSTRNGRSCGAWSACAALSFFPTKNLGAAGDAGMLLTNDDSIAELAKSLRVHGMAKQQYMYEDIGHTSRLDEIQAAILRVKFQKLAQWNELRRNNAAIYDRALASSEIQVPYVLPESTYHPYHQYTVRSQDRDAFMKYLMAHEVSCAIYYPVPLHLQPAYRSLGYQEGDFPNAESAAKQVLSLPVQPHLSTEQVEFAADVAKHFASERVGA